MFTGLPCPTCGLTHATIAILHGHLLESLKYHPLLIPALATITGGFVDYLNIKRLPGFLLSFLIFLGRNQTWHFILLTLIVVLYILRLILNFPNGPYPMIYDHQNYAELLMRIAYRIVCCIKR